MRVLLADDEPKVRSALRLVLEQLKGIEGVEEVENATSLADRLEHTHPDLLFLDWELPGLNARSLFSEIRHSSQLKVIVLSGVCQTPDLVLASGADAFISKCEPPDRLFAALKMMGVN
jgi:DNA-binding NarL/FixJ family response regulator